MPPPTLPLLATNISMISGEASNNIPGSVVGDAVWAGQHCYWTNVAAWTKWRQKPCHQNVGVQNNA